MSKVIAQIARLLVFGIATTLYACAQSTPMDRTAEAKRMVTREVPLGMQREAVLAKLDSLKIPFTALDTLHVRALVRNTSRSAFAIGSLQVILTFGSDGKLQRHEFKEMFIAP